MQLDEKPARIAVLVLGMHRSGTSLLARLLSLYGCDLPHNVLAGNEANSKGYWEPSAVVEVNDALLASAGSSWHDWLPFNPDWYASPRQAEYLDRACDVLKTEYGTSRLFMLKDPRICRILPFWLRAFVREGITPVALIPVRHPALVARSIALRDCIPPSVGVLLWARHVLEAEAASRDLTRTFLTYRQVIEDWYHLPGRLAAELQLHWPVNSPGSRAAQADFVDPAMAHGEAAMQAWPDHQILPPLIEQLWSIMARWAQMGEDRADYDALDALRADLDHAGTITGDAIVAGMNTRWLASELEQKLQVAEQEIARGREIMASHEALVQEHASRADEAAALEARAQADQAALIEERNASSALAAELAQAVAETRAAESRANASEVQAAQWRAQLSSTQSNLSQRYEEIEQLRVSLEKERLFTVTLRAEAEAALQAKAEVEERNADLTREAAEYRLHVAHLEAEIAKVLRRARKSETVAVGAKIQDMRVRRLTEELELAREQLGAERRRAAAVSEDKRSAQCIPAASIADNDEVAIQTETRVVDEVSKPSLEESHHYVDPARQQAEWVRELSVATWGRVPWWQELMPLGWRLRAVKHYLAPGKRFNPETYLARYPDVAAAGVDPLLHYLRHGIAEGRLGD